MKVTLLWGDVAGYVYLPYALQHPRLTLGLSNLLKDNLYAKFGGKSQFSVRMGKIQGGATIFDTADVSNSGITARVATR